jgi:argininosuccinate lyase
MIGEMINEQEAVAMRQVQLGTSVSYLQDQLDLVRQESEQGAAPLARVDLDMIEMLETRVSSLQGQIDQQMHMARIQNGQENESWVYLLGLLTAIQERIRVLSEEHPGTAPTQTPPGYDHLWN